MPVFLLAISQTENPDLGKLIAAFFIIHFLVYPASNGYNSYVDRDETPIGGLEKPPMPTPALFRLTLAMDLLALVLAWTLVGPIFMACLGLYIGASRAYSSPQIRLKKYPFIGFLTVIWFQGGFTYVMSRLGISPSTEFLTQPSQWFMMAACTLQLAGAYPLTQVYQHEADKKDGVITLSYRLGYRGTFVFTGIMFGLANLFYFLYFQNTLRPNQFIELQVFFIPVVGYFLYWMSKVWKNPLYADFAHTMRMNQLAALCMNACFLLFIFQNHIR